MAIEKKFMTVIQFRRDSTTNWLLNKDTVPASGEPCYDMDLKTLRIGDGKTTYENLPVIGSNQEEIDAIGKLLEALQSGLDDVENNIEAINNANTGILKQAKDYADSKDKTIESAQKAGEDAMAEAKARVAYVTPTDNSIAIAGTTTNPTVGVRLSADTDNTLTLAHDGLKVVVPTVAEYSIVKSDNPGEYASVYNLTKDGVVVGVPINIPKDIVVKSGTVVGNEIVLVLNDDKNTEIKIPVDSLIEYVTSGSVAGDMVHINVSDDHMVTATITDGSITLTKMTTDVQNAINKAHTHKNASVLDNITSEKVSVWDTVKDDVNALSNKVGSVPTDKTIVQMIEDAQAAATYDDTDIKNDIASNTNAIKLLTNGVSADKVDSVNDLIEYVEEHGAEVAGIKADIKANSNAITAEKDRAENIESDLNIRLKSIEAIDIANKAEAPDWAQNDPTKLDYIKNRLAWTEDDIITSITFDGNIDGRKLEYTGDVESSRLMKISDEVIDIIKIDNIEWTDSKGTSKITKDEWEVYHHLAYTCIGVRLMPYIMSIPHDYEYNPTTIREKGTYILIFTDDKITSTGYVSKINLIEHGDIHKIDPKYYDRIAWVDETEREYIIPETTFTSDEDGLFMYPGNIVLNEGSKYIISVNGMEYESECISVEDGKVMYVLGNIGVIDECFPITDVPIIFVSSPDDGAFMFDYISAGSGTCILSISTAGKVHKVDPMFLDTPDMDAQEGEPGYIANKPCYRAREMVNILSNIPLINSNTASIGTHIEQGNLCEIFSRLGDKAVVYINDSQYECKIIIPMDDGMFSATPWIIGFRCSTFDVLIYANLGILLIESNEGFPDQSLLSIDVEAFTYKKIDYRYLPHAQITLPIDLADYMNSNRLSAEQMSSLYNSLHTNKNTYISYHGELVELYYVNGFVFDGGSIMENYNPSIKFRSLDGMYEYWYYSVGSTGGAVECTLVHHQVDYAQNDDTKPDYVKNRLAYTEEDFEVILPETACTISDSGVGLLKEGSLDIVAGQKYTVTFDGTNYDVEPVYVSNINMDGLILGNSKAIDGTDTGEPFTILYQISPINAIVLAGAAPGSSHTVTISTIKEVVHTIDAKYLPDIDAKTFGGKTVDEFATKESVNEQINEAVEKKSQVQIIIFEEND